MAKHPTLKYGSNFRYEIIVYGTKGFFSGVYYPIFFTPETTTNGVEGNFFL